MKEKRKRGRPRKTWKLQVEREREREQECWIEEGGCNESSKIESGSRRDCWQSGVNPATLVYGDKPGSKLE